jgi:hypothetical protein
MKILVPTIATMAAPPPPATTMIMTTMNGVMNEGFMVKDIIESVNEKERGWIHT